MIIDPPQSQNISPCPTSWQLVPFPFNPAARKPLNSCGPLALLTTPNKSSGIAKFFARYRYHPCHPLLCSHPPPTRRQPHPSYRCQRSHPQSLDVPVAIDKGWPTDAADSKNVWPNPPTLSPATPTNPNTHTCWECGCAGHLVVGCPITGIRQRTNVTVCGFLHDYDRHCTQSHHLCLQMDHTAEEYGYHKQVLDHMINTANWTGYPARIIPTFNESHPREPPPVIGAPAKHRRLV